MNEYFVYEIELPYKIKGVTTPNDDGTFTVYLNSRLSNEIKKEALAHEVAHIKLNHFYREEPVAVLEKEVEEYLKNVSKKRRTVG